MVIIAGASCFDLRFACLINKAAVNVIIKIIWIVRIAVLWEVEIKDR